MLSQQLYFIIRRDLKEIGAKATNHQNWIREKTGRQPVSDLNFLFTLNRSLRNSTVRSAFVSFRSEYVSIYRSILKIIYWPIYDDRILTDICILFKNHFLIDICRNFAFFDRYMKIFIFPKLAIFDFCSMFRSIKTSYIGQYNNSYPYTPYRFAA